MMMRVDALDKNIIATIIKSNDISIDQKVAMVQRFHRLAISDLRNLLVRNSLIEFTNDITKEEIESHDNYDWLESWRRTIQNEILNIK